MIERPTIFDEAEMKQQFREMYRDIGFDGCRQVLYEFLKSSEWLSEIMLDERFHDK